MPSAISLKIDITYMFFLLTNECRYFYFYIHIIKLKIALGITWVDMFKEEKIENLKVLFESEFLIVSGDILKVRK